MHYVESKKFQLEAYLQAEKKLTYTSGRFSFL